MDMTDLLESAGLRDDHTGAPEIVHWLLIKPNGTVRVSQSDNRIAYVAEYDLWFQWRLERDVHREIDPFTRGPWRPIVWSVGIPTDRHGVIVAARLDADRPDNPMATAMLAALGVDHWVRGPAAWLGERDPTNGLHRDLTATQLRELRAVAAHCRT